MTSKKWLVVVCGTCLLVSYFLPWVIWDGSSLGGHALATGDFFRLAEDKLGLANPFPQLNFTFYAFWLIPVLSAAIVLLTALNKKTGPLPFITGFLSLSLITLYILFTDFGIGKNTIGLLKVGAWLHLVAAIGLILSSPTSLLKKLAWVILGPVLVFASFKLIEKKMMSDTHKSTAGIKADYSMSPASLINEFITNDTSANKKYLDKVIEISGPVSIVEIAVDSTSTIKFADSTGSYAIFSLEKTEFEQVKNIQKGDAVSVKGVCSGSIFSEILGTTSISFKRTILNKK